MTTTRALEWLKLNGYHVATADAPAIDPQSLRLYGLVTVISGPGLDHPTAFGNPVQAVDWIKSLLAIQNRANDETLVLVAENAAAGRLESFAGFFD